ncbi:MAG: CPBP family intramembrane glutamic endopeptidase [Kofleriaceae bacterium]
MRYASSRPAPLSRTTLVLGLYGAMALLALMIAAGRGDPDAYRAAVRGPAWLLASPVVGLLAGLVLVALSQAAARFTRWGQALRQSFRDLLGPLATRDIVVLAAASAVGEELLFRGALLPWLGPVAQAALFAALHIGPGRRFVPWTLSAFACGLVLAGLVAITGDLGAAIVAHFTINFCNLRFIVGARAGERSRVESPA